MTAIDKPEEEAIEIKDVEDDPAEESDNESVVEVVEEAKDLDPVEVSNLSVISVSVSRLLFLISSDTAENRESVSIFQSFFSICCVCQWSNGVQC